MKLSILWRESVCVVRLSTTLNLRYVINLNFPLVHPSNPCDPHVPVVSCPLRGMCCSEEDSAGRSQRGVMILLRFMSELVNRVSLSLGRIRVSFFEFSSGSVYNCDIHSSRLVDSAPEVTGFRTSGASLQDVHSVATAFFYVFRSECSGLLTAVLYRCPCFVFGVAFGSRLSGGRKAPKASRIYHYDCRSIAVNIATSLL
jgi:hypothetical protein